MKIVYVIEKLSGIGGMERILVDKLNWLCKQEGIDLTLMLIWDDNQPIEYPIDNRVKIIRLNVTYVKGGFSYPIALYRYNKKINELKPSVTVFCWVMGAFLAAYGHSYGKTIFESHLAAIKMKHKWLLNKMQHKVDAVITLTNHDTTYFNSAPCVKVIPNFTLLSPTLTPSYQSKHCVALGRMVSQKDYTRMIAIWKEIAKLHPDWILDIYGDGEERPLIERAIKEAKLDNQVVLHGNTKDIEKAYTSGSIYLMTSQMEGFPLVLIEAMKCGLPVIAFDCPYGPKDVIKHGVTGYLIPYDNDKVYIETLSTLIDDASLRKQMGMSAKQAATQFSCESIMDSWLKLFQTITE